MDMMDVPKSSHRNEPDDKLKYPWMIFVGEENVKDHVKTKHMRKKWNAIEADLQKSERLFQRWSLWDSCARGCFRIFVALCLISSTIVGVVAGATSWTTLSYIAAGLTAIGALQEPLEKLFITDFTTRKRRKYHDECRIRRKYLDQMFINFLEAAEDHSIGTDELKQYVKLAKEMDEELMKSTMDYPDLSQFVKSETTDAKSKTTGMKSEPTSAKSETVPPRSSQPAGDAAQDNDEYRKRRKNLDRMFIKFLEAAEGHTISMDKLKQYVKLIYEIDHEMMKRVMEHPELFTHILQSQLANSKTILTNSESTGAKVETTDAKFVTTDTKGETIGLKSEMTNTKSKPSRVKSKSMRAKHKNKRVKSNQTSCYSGGSTDSEHMQEPGKWFLESTVLQIH